MNYLLNNTTQEEYDSKIIIRDEIIATQNSYIDGSSLKDFSKIGKYMKGVSEYIDRGIIFAHLDFEPITTLIANKKPFTIVSGKNPSSSLTLGHYATFKMLLAFQKLGADIIIPLTSDESFTDNKTDSLKKGEEIARKIIFPQIIAMGFNPRKTKVIIQSEYLDMYRMIYYFGKEVNLQSMYSAFGKTGFENVAQVIYRGAAQLSTILMPQLEEFGGPRNVLIPVSVDQHPYILLARDVAKKMNLVPPSEIVIPFLQSYRDPFSKMSSSKPEGAIYLTDTMPEIEQKLNRAYTGAISSLDGHRALGGIPEIDSCFQILRYLYEDRAFVEQIYSEYKSGKLLASELKKITIEFVQKLIGEIQIKAENVSEEDIDGILLKTKITSI